jgi:hypothetical protein
MNFSILHLKIHVHVLYIKNFIHTWFYKVIYMCVLISILHVLAIFVYEDWPILPIQKRNWKVHLQNSLVGSFFDNVHVQWKINFNKNHFIKWWKFRYAVSVMIPGHFKIWVNYLPYSLRSAKWNAKMKYLYSNILKFCWTKKKRFTSSAFR